MINEAGEHFPSDKLDKFVVRMPEGMREALRKAAQANGRSMNSEVVERLRISLATLQNQTLGGMSQSQSQPQTTETEEKTQFLLNLPASLKEHIDRKAKENGRSKSGEVVYALHLFYQSKQPE